MQVLPHVSVNNLHKGKEKKRKCVNELLVESNYLALLMVIMKMEGKLE